MTEKVVLPVAVDVVVNRIWLTQSCRHTPSYFASSASAGDTAEDDTPEGGEAEENTSEGGEADAFELPEPPPPHATSIIELRKTARYFI